VVVILLVFMALVLITADFLIRRRMARRRKPPATVTAAMIDLLVPSLQPERFHLPGGLFFHQGHTWANVLFSGHVKVGVDDFLQRLVGRIDDIRLPPMGTAVREGMPLVTIRQAGRTATLPAPVDGVVCAVNAELMRSPDLVKRDPYTRGWLVALQPTNLAANLSRLKVGAEALAWLKAEVARFQKFVSGILTEHQDAVVGMTAVDGGLHVDGLLEHLNDEAWRRFTRDFAPTSLAQGWR
jgi:glycine cleavage system H lipoate-binding protein